jgi:hypothetical protein
MDSYLNASAIVTTPQQSSPHFGIRHHASVLDTTLRHSTPRFGTRHHASVLDTTLRHSTPHFGFQHHTSAPRLDTYLNVSALGNLSSSIIDL